MRRKTKNPDILRLRDTLRWRLTLFVLSILLTSGCLTVALCVLILLWFDQTPPVVAIMVNPVFVMVTLLLICAIIGTVLSSFLGKLYLKPLKMLIGATREVKKGNYKVQVERDKAQLTEMGRLIQSFNEMVHELDGIELFRNDFINNFSHEFKTPIVSIRGFAKELERGDLSPEQSREYAKIIAEEADRLARLSTSVLGLSEKEQQEYIAIIAAESDRLTNMATSILLLSKLENQQIVTDQAEFYLDEQIRQCILLQESAWVEKEIEMIPELPETLFYSNEELLSHIWTNLIGNAIRFTPRGGCVRVTLYADEKQVTVEIRDNGIGMSDAVRERIFEKFYQGDPSHHRHGYGIGLTMAQRAAILCGGGITVESSPGQGSAFTVKLPRENPTGRLDNSQPACYNEGNLEKRRNGK